MGLTSKAITISPNMQNSGLANLQSRSTADSQFRPFPIQTNPKSRLGTWLGSAESQSIISSLQSRGFSETAQLSSRCLFPGIDNVPPQLHSNSQNRFLPSLQNQESAPSAPNQQRRPVPSVKFRGYRGKSDRSREILATRVKSLFLLREEENAECDE
jgi:hypothetical protein